MKKLYAVILGLLFVPVMALAENPAIDFVNNTADKVINEILTADVSRDEKIERFRETFTNALDLKNIGQFVLGVHWRKASPEDREAFLNAFMDFTTKTWADRFDSYQGQKIVFTGVRNAEKNQFYVDSTIQNNPPVEVIWRLKQKDNSYRIIDIIVEGVSMAMSYRNEYSSFLQKHDGKVSVLTAELKQKSDNFQWGSSQK
ncbi:MAG: ABC transporter substrate-binding protein [Alphaproteobacteria bacterium]|nr:ABC transporter substrate-binding protein [Alphaproteobacteria bacterium]